MCVQIDWSTKTKQDLDDFLRRQRVDDTTIVVVLVKGFNHFRYKLNWGLTKTEDKAYGSLADLWDKIFPIAGAVGLAGGAGPGPAALQKWVSSIMTYDTELADELTQYSALDVPPALRDLLPERRRHFAAALTKVEQNRSTFLKNADWSIQLDSFLKVDPLHQTLSKRLSDFVAAADLVVDGASHVIASEKRGTWVQVSITPQTSAGDQAGAPETFKYFVQTVHPLVYHLGYAYGRIQDVQFEKVRALSGQDLFSEVTHASQPTQPDQSASDLVAMLSWELGAMGPDRRFGFLATLGTGFTSPGKSYYYGGSVRVFSKLFLTGGGVVANTQQGQGQTSETTAGGVRDLYAELKHVWKSKPYLSISFRLY